MQHLLLAITADIAHALSNDLPLPKTLQNWRENMELEDFKQGTWEVLSLVYQKSISVSSQYAHALLSFLCREIADIFDNEDISSLDQMPVTQNEIKELLTRGKRSREAYMLTLIKQLDPTLPYIVLETSFPTTSQQKCMFREDIEKKYGLCFPVFRTNNALIGGFRIYVNSEITDYSLRGELETIFSQFYLNV